VSNLVKLVGPHGSIAFATPEKAARLKSIQGYKEYQEPSESASEDVSEPKKPTRGRPKKA
jgi:hypothetical protein